MTIQIVAILSDGRTITGQANCITKAQVRLAEWSLDLFYLGTQRIIRAFLGNEDGLLEYTEQEIKELAQNVNKPKEG